MAIDLQTKPPLITPPHIAAAPFKLLKPQLFSEKSNRRIKKMSRRNGQKLDMKPNLSPPTRAESPSRSLSVSPTSPPSSCVSSEPNQQDEYSTSPEETSMMLVGCPRCLMYVMLSEEDPRCPKCKSTVLLDVIHQNSGASTAGGRKTRKG